MVRDLTTATNGLIRRRQTANILGNSSPFLLFVVLLITLDGGKFSGCHASTVSSIKYGHSLQRRRLAPFTRGIAVNTSGRPTWNHENFRGGSTTKANSWWPILLLPPWSHKVLAGGSSRALAQALLYPVDALRTLAQTRDGRTLADVGAKALVRGCAQTSSFALVMGALQFGIYGMVQPHYGPLIASTCGAAGSCLVSVPQEVIKQRLVTGVYSSFRDAVRTIWRTQGVRGFYSAWRPTVSRNVPFVITTFTSRDMLSRRLLQQKQKQQVKEFTSNNKKNKLSSKDMEFTAVENLAIGIASALVGGLVTQPIDVVKTRMMTQAASNAVPYTSALDCAVTVLRTEGWRKLYSGFGQRSIYMCGLWGITFAVEPMLTRYLAENNKNSNQAPKR